MLEASNSRISQFYWLNFQKIVSTSGFYHFINSHCLPMWSFLAKFIVLSSLCLPGFNLILELPWCCGSLGPTTRFPSRSIRQVYFCTLSVCLTWRKINLSTSDFRYLHRINLCIAAAEWFFSCDSSSISRNVCLSVCRSVCLSVCPQRVLWKCYAVFSVQMLLQLL